MVSRPFRLRRITISQLTWRILAVNLMALGVLVVGLLYLGEYRANLIATELASLQKQARMFAAAVGEGAVSPSSADITVPRQALIPNAARQMIRRLVEPTGTRARLFGADGVLIVDSRMLLGPGGLVQIEELPPPTAVGNGFFGTLLEGYDTLVSLLPGTTELPPYQESAHQRAGDYPEVLQALSGDTGHFLRQSGPRMMLSVAAPVQRYKHVLGAVMLSKDSRAIDTALYDVRLDILKVFGIALAITIALSLYLAGTIARPIRLLAKAAEIVRMTHNRQATIPRFPGRTDEIGELAEALNDMTNALWRRMDAIEGFAADVAHEIKNPLTSLHSAVETIARIKDPEQQRQLMGIIQEDVKRLDLLISDISDASRLDAELSRAEMEPVDLTGLLGAVADMQVSARSGEGTRLELDLPGGELRINGLTGRLVQVFRNLISNAVSFSPPDGVITLRGSIEDGDAQIEVLDQGPGIPAGKEADIFSRFYSERPEGEAFGTHSGLGLNISQQIVEAHGGRIWAENRHGENGRVIGARFVVRLPLV